MLEIQGSEIKEIVLWVLGNIVCNSEEDLLQVLHHSVLKSIVYQLLQSKITLRNNAFLVVIPLFKHLDDQLDAFLEQFDLTTFFRN